jgi:Kef-type K+ transport system membrane component KefB/mannitol/fructose-specific phosphotransferase system IIA component (Ntr-type)
VHHDVLFFLLGLAALLGVARIFGEVCRRFGLPAVAGEIISGVVLGRTLLGRFAPGAFAWLFPDGPARTMLTGYTTVAVMLLLVVAGIEIDLTVVRKSGRVVVASSVLGVVVPFALGYGLGLVLPASDLPDPSRRGLHAAFLGIALSISALPVIAKTLLDLGLMKTDLGLIILSAAVFNDLVGWTGFSVLSHQLAAPGGGSGGILTSLLLTLAFVGGALLGVRPVVDALLGRLQGRDDAATGRVLSVVMVLALLGAAATQALGMHPVFGGFVMGIAVGDSPRLRERTRQILHDFVSYVFTPVFFATMALRYDFAAAFDLRLTALVLTIACVAKIAGCAAGARLAGVANREALAIGFGLNSRGAMEILLAVLALEAGIIAERLFIALVVMAVATSLLSGPALVRILRSPSSPIAALLRAGTILLDVPVSEGDGAREALLGALGEALAERLDPPVEGALITRQVLVRERLASTGVGDGVAFPHAEVPGLARPLLAFARLARGLDFDAPDGQPVRLVFLLLVPPREYDRSLQVLSAMARLLTRDEVRRALCEAGDAGAVLALIEEAQKARGPASVGSGASRSQGA